MNLKILRRDGSDVVFLLPWRGKEVAVKYEAPAGCIGPSFVFREELFSDEEADEIHEFLQDKVNVSTIVTIGETQ